MDSPRHFYYSLVHKKLKKDYYSLREGSINNSGMLFGDRILHEDLKLSYDKDSITYELNYKGMMEIRRFFKSPSFFIFNFQYALIDKYGNLLTPYSNVEIYGQWANQGIADILPLDYKYDGN